MPRMPGRSCAINSPDVDVDHNVKGFISIRVGTRGTGIHTACQLTKSIRKRDSSPESLIKIVEKGLALASAL